MFIAFCGRGQRVLRHRNAVRDVPLLLCAYRCSRPCSPIYRKSFLAAIAGLPTWSPEHVSQEADALERKPARPAQTTRNSRPRRTLAVVSALSDPAGLWWKLNGV